MAADRVADRAADKAGAGFGFATPFQAQLDFFQAKLNLPTERWNDIWQEAHDKSFVVAGAMKADLLSDLRGAVAQSISGELTYDEFHKRFLEIARAQGWVNWTGSGSEAGQAWRTRIVYQTNMATSYAAGRYKQLSDPDFLERYPYWVYHHLDSVEHPRPEHVAWNGLTLHHTHPFWRTHFPPNGWGCHCWVTATDAAGYQAAQAKGKGEPPAGWDALDAKTGAPVGIDKGWAYAPGESVYSQLGKFVTDKIAKVDAPVGAALWGAVSHFLVNEERAVLGAMVDRVAAEKVARAQAVQVHVLRPEVVAALSDPAIALPPQTALVQLRDTELLHAIRDGVNEKANLSLDVWRNLPAHMDAASIYFDTINRNLLFVFDAPDGTSKVVVGVHYRVKIAGVGKTDGNFVWTGGLIPSRQLIAERYVLIWPTK